MVSRARKVPELPVANTVANTDLFIIEKVSGNTSTTSRISGTNMRKAMVRGPFVNDTAAGIGGISIGELYYTNDGSVKVRLS